MSRIDIHVVQFNSKIWGNIGVSTQCIFLLSLNLRTSLFFLFFVFHFQRVRLLLFVHVICLKIHDIKKFLLCFQVYTPTQNVVIDEILEKWKGRLSWKQYIPAKRERFGIMLFLLCESGSSYISNLQVYIGSATDVHVGINLEYGVYNDLLISTRIVIYLISQLLFLGYCVVTDSWYTSPELLLVLKELGTNALGTVRVNRKMMPVEFSTARPLKGDVISWRSHDRMIATKWNDGSKKTRRL